jgi:hypothetical protein
MISRFHDRNATPFGCPACITAAVKAVGTTPRYAGIPAWQYELSGQATVVKYQQRHDAAIRRALTVQS